LPFTAGSPYPELGKNPSTNRREPQGPKGNIRVIGVGTFEGPREDCLISDFGDRELVLRVARRKGGTMNPTHVYDDHGKSIGHCGTV